MKKFTIDEFPSIGGIVCSKMVTEEKLKPHFIFREKPKTDRPDSGWVIFSGFESDEYSNDSNNFGIYNPKTILEIDDSIAEILLYKGIGSVWKKNEEGVWEEVFDYPLEDDFMTEQKLTENWSLSINNLFIRKTEDSNLLFTTNDKSLRISIWNYEGKNKEEIAQQKQQEISDINCIKRYKVVDENTIKIGYHIKEYDEYKDYEYNLICGFTIIDNEILFNFLYFDNDRDLQWALDTWKSIKFKK